jgi:hypothetical protein
VDNGALERTSARCDGCALAASCCRGECAAVVSLSGFRFTVGGMRGGATGWVEEWLRSRRNAPSSAPVPVVAPQPQTQPFGANSRRGIFCREILELCYEKQPKIGRKAGLGDTLLANGRA